MTENKSYLTYYQDIDGGFVAFVGSPKEGNGPEWLFNIDSLTKSMNYEPATAGNQTNGCVSIKTNVNAGQAGQEKASDHEYILLPLMLSNSLLSSSTQSTDYKDVDGKEGYANSTNRDSTASPSVSTARPSINIASENINTSSPNINTASPIPNDSSMQSLENTGIFNDAYDDREVGAEADLNNLETTMNVSPIPTARIHKDHPKDQIIRDINSATQTKRMTKIYEEHIMVWILVNLPKGKKAIGTKWVYRNKKDERGIVVRNKARLMDVKSAFLYVTIEEEVYVCQHPSFEDLQFPNKVYKENRFRRGTIDKTLFIKKDKGDILLVQVYVDDIIFGSTKKSLCVEFEQMMHKRFQMSSMGELTFFLGLQVQQKEDGDKFQVTPKTSHLHAVKRIFRYLKGQPKLGLWQTIVANSTTKAEYVVAANCYRQVLWIQNQMLDYGFNFMNTKIHIDNESTVFIMKNPVFHSKTKHIEIRHHFIRDSYEKKLIQVIKIHTDHNVADLLTKAFDVSRKAKRTTEISQSSGPIHLVADETVYKEWEDRMERAATTASSLEAEQDSGSGPRCQDTILGGVEAQIRFEAASKQSNDPPLSRVNTLESGEDSMKLKELMELCAFLEKPEESDGFEEIIDFLNATLVDKKKVIITETSIRSDLKLDDAEGIDCLPTATIFAELERMGYENLTQKLTFYKAYFSSQWKFLIHTILQCLSAKTTAWNEFSSTMASAIICLATNQKFNFSKYIFDNMVKHLEGGVKFLMYPRFVQVFLDKQVEGMTRHKEVYVTPSHTKKVFANMKRPGKGFSGRVTPLFPTMMIQASEDMGEDSAAPSDSHSTPKQEGNALFGFQDLCLRQELLEYMCVHNNDASESSKPSWGKMYVRRIVADFSHAPPNEYSPSPNDKKQWSLEWEDRMERAATTASSLEVEQDSGSGPRVNTLGSGEDSMKLMELMEHCTKLSELYCGAKVSTASPEVKTAVESLVYIRRSAAKRKDKGKAIMKEAKPIQKKTKLQLEQERLGLEEALRLSKIDVEQELNQESSKRQKIGEGSEPIKESKDELSQEQLQQLIIIVLEEGMNVEALQTKYPLIDWEVYTEDSRKYWKIIIVGNQTEVYQIFEDMQKNFERDDLVKLWSLDHERFNSTEPTEDKERELWVELKRLFEPDDDDILCLLGNALMNFMFAKNDEDLSFLPREPSLGFGTGSPPVSINNEPPLLEAEPMARANSEQMIENIADSGGSLTP
ncbi:putative ribonuclease H-like domain-containing protein [Tanacetum coccineum]|uniref:Ribonuclease H-like domain-containing protein n=1 Tax=Tanacetum coccineum TaxID=301880 RepID=A0ABQ5E7K4_9ASTR